MVWLSRNWNYMLLFTTFTIGLGVMNLMLTLVNQIVEPYGYDNDQAGYCNAALLVTGLIGAGITSKVLETYVRFLFPLSLCLSLSLCLCLSLSSSHAWHV